MKGRKSLAFAANNNSNTWPFSDVRDGFLDMGSTANQSAMQYFRRLYRQRFVKLEPLKTGLPNQILPPQQKTKVQSALAFTCVISSYKRPAII